MIWNGGARLTARLLSLAQFRAQKSDAKNWLSVFFFRYLLILETLE